MACNGSMMSGLMTLVQTPGLSWIASASSQHLVKGTLRLLSTTLCTFLEDEPTKVLTSGIWPHSASPRDDGILSKTWGLRLLQGLVIA